VRSSSHAALLPSDHWEGDFIIFFSIFWAYFLGVWGLGFGVFGLGFGVWGSGCGVWGLGFEVWGLGFRIEEQEGEKAAAGVVSMISYRNTYNL